MARQSKREPTRFSFRRADSAADRPGWRQFYRSSVPKLEMTMEIIIRSFKEADSAHVEELFIQAIKTIAPPPPLREFFDHYVRSALREEIGRVAEYYGERLGAFWVANAGPRIVGMFGLIPVPSTPAAELRRMYVDPDVRRRGVARAMLNFAEGSCRRQNVARIELSTSELNREAMSLYKTCGYAVSREEAVEIAGVSVRTFYLTKQL